MRRRRGGRLPVTPPPFDRRPVGRPRTGSRRAPVFILLPAAHFIVIQPHHGVIDMSVKGADADTTIYDKTERSAADSGCSRRRSNKRHEQRGSSRKIIFATVATSVDNGRRSHLGSC